MTTSEIVLQVVSEPLNQRLVFCRELIQSCICLVQFQHGERVILRVFVEITTVRNETDTEDD